MSDSRTAQARKEGRREGGRADDYVCQAANHFKRVVFVVVLCCIVAITLVRVC